VARTEQIAAKDTKKSPVSASEVASSRRCTRLRFPAADSRPASAASPKRAQCWQQAGQTSPTPIARKPSQRNADAIARVIDSI